MTTSSFQRLCRARDTLRDAVDPAPSIAAIAREAAMSPFHFIRQFEAMFGSTPHQYRIRSRIERAKELLALGELSVTEVCMEVGFSSLGSFSDLFTRRVGSSPSAYRRAVRPLVVVAGRLPPALAPGCLSLMAAAFAILEKPAAGASGRL